MTSIKAVLVVEDDPIVRMTTQRQLTALGYKSFSVESGEEAVAHDHSDVGLILMDMGLPGIDGLHATLLIREKELREQRARIPIVALTAHSNRASCMSVGMDGFLQKPALLDDVRQVLDQFMT